MVQHQDTSTARKNPSLKNRRSQRVYVEIPVWVYGQLNDEPFHEEALTVIVNAHGGLINLSKSIAVGEKLFLAHKKTGKDMLCHVVHVGPTENGKTQIGIEFTEPAPKFWNIVFPHEDWKPSERKLPQARQVPSVPKTQPKRS